MRRRSRLLRVAKWGGVVACGAIVVIFVASGWFWMTWTDSNRFVVILKGCVAVSMEPDQAWSLLLPGGGEISGAKPGFRFVPVSGPDFRFWVPLREMLDDWLTLTLPLWVVFLLIAGPTSLCWLYDRRRPKPGHCRCGYDLTGNESGTCPECGVEVEA